MGPTEYVAHLTSLEAMDASLQVTVVRLANSAATATEVWLEPWGDSIVLAPGSQYDLVASGPPGGVDKVSAGDVLTIDWVDGAIKVWVASYAQSLRIFQDGSLVWEP
ncbi:MAG TPA: hypothetical protein VII06_33405 [Chloroflexota bacterium]|jgi:hypothetical protein